MGKRKKQWMPLESNPDIMNKYLLELGAGGPYQFVDVFGVDPELLSLVPQPVAAVVLLYPISRAVPLSALSLLKL
jgi:ubiquitin carboxyl-terminal hydrolase L3